MIEELKAQLDYAIQAMHQAKSDGVRAYFRGKIDTLTLAIYSAETELMQQQGQPNWRHAAIERLTLEVRSNPDLCATGRDALISVANMLKHELKDQAK